MEVVLSEPVELRDRMRRVAAGAPALARAALPAAVAEFVTAAMLAAGNPARGDEVAMACAGYERELWLWLAGERTWAQCSAGLYGRIGRRIVA